MGPLGNHVCNFLHLAVPLRLVANFGPVLEALFDDVLQDPNVLCLGILQVDARPLVVLDALLLVVAVKAAGVKDVLAAVGGLIVVARHAVVHDRVLRHVDKHLLLDVAAVSATPEPHGDILALC